MQPIQAVGAVPSAQQWISAAAPSGGAATGGVSFKDVLLDSLARVNSMQQQANGAVEKMAAGGQANPAEVLTAVQQADMAFRTVMQVRDALMEAYNEIKDLRT